MKTKQEMKKMISLLSRLQKGMPTRSNFGDDNYGDIGIQISVISSAVIKNKDEDDLEEELNQAYDDDSEKRQDALLWCLGQLSDDLTDEEEVVRWEKRMLKL